ncbi:MAG TPA: ABC-2 family transporter protein [Roseiflexaceae bacterium]|nr:ABC-2 family transporter protein [Roseiflexaceae bacterium]
MATIGIAFSMWAASVRSELQYRANFIIMVLMGIVYQCTGFVFIWVVLSRFQAVAGWTLGEVAFLYGLRLVMHALNGAITGGLYSLEWKVRQGEFDRYLVRPVPPLLQLLCERVHISVLGDLLGGLALFAAASSLVAIDWTPLALVYLALALIGGALVELAMRLLVSALAFRFLSGNALMGLLDTVFSNFSNYPLKIFGSTLEFLLTFGIPLAFMAYFPAAVLLGRTGELQVSPLFAYAAPLAGLAWLLAALWIFHYAMRAYQSAGH